MFAEVAEDAETAEVSNTATLTNAEHHAHLTDNWDDAEGYYRVQVCCIFALGNRNCGISLRDKNSFAYTSKSYLRRPRSSTSATTCSVTLDKESSQMW